MDDQGKDPIGKGAAKKETVEERENRLWEEAEAKRRAEVAQRLREAAEESARRRDEEDRLWEEGVAKRKAEKEQRIREEAANPRAKEERRLKEEAEARSKQRAAEQLRKEEAEAEAKRIAETAKRSREEAEATAKRKAKEEGKIREEAKLSKQKSQEEQRLLKEAETKRKAEKERIKVSEARVKQRTEQDKRGREEDSKRKVEHSNSQKVVAQYQVEKPQSGKNNRIKKRVLVGGLLAVLAVVAIWTFTKFDSSIDEENLPEQKIDAIDIKDSEPETTNVDTPKASTTLSKLAIGDRFEGGIIFEIDQDGKTGKIAHAQDAGPMPWNEANKIHEQLGEGWRLPTFHELSKMYRTIGQGATNSGQFADGLYWSATAYETYQARLLRFRDGNGSYHYNKEVESRKFRVRAIRDFSR